MKMFFKRATALTFALAVIASVYACNHNIKQATDDNEPYQVSEQEKSSVFDILSDFGGGHSTGMYSDFSGSFSQMEKDYAVQIVRGVVKSAGPASPEAVAQKAVVEVSCVYKGRELKTIHVFQLYDNPVSEGEEYLLFLGLQHPDDPDSLDFYPVGGDQGALKIDRQSRRIVVNSPFIADNDLKQWLIENHLDKNDDSAQIADYKIVLHSDLNND